jgi:hypothetical protein
MKNEHVTSRANDIKQAYWEATQHKKKKNQIFFLFSLSFIFRILFYFCHSLIFLFFYFNIEDNVVFKVWGYGENFDFLCCFSKKKESKFYLLNSHWFMRIWVLCMKISWDRWRYKSNEWVCMQVLTFNWFRDWLWKYVMLTL